MNWDRVESDDAIVRSFSANLERNKLPGRHTRMVDTH